ncbi:hypothetical protein HYW58_02660 [Candidatus Kaiserbacteria bacterium]|nr:hypothetical protein [Candidatus Kaiserbacteria bacterium]
MDEYDRIENLRRRLYSRKNAVPKDHRHGLSGEGSTSIERVWAEPHTKKVMPQREKKSFLKIFFIFSILFFLGSALFGGFYFFGGKNIVSSENVDIQIQGPTAIGGGDELELQISIVNKNTTTLELTDLLVEYPEGTRAPGNLQSEFLRYRESLGNIAPGERVKKNVRSILFGEENTQKEIIVTVEYRVAGSNAIFYSEKPYLITLSSAPVSVSVRSLNEVISGQEIDFSVVISSNSTGRVENLVLQAEYPFGFTFKEAQPQAQYSNSVWELGTVAPEEKRTIRIVGVMTGQDNEERIFRFAVGVRDERDVKKLATSFVTTTRSITIERPFISTELALNNSIDTSYVFGNEESIQGEIAWKNNLPNAVSNVQIEVKLSGNAIDKSSITAERGFYNSVTDTIRWSRDTLENFESVEPSQAGLLRFDFKSRDISASSIANPNITLEITVRGNRTGEGNVSETIESDVTRAVKIASDLRLTPRILHNSGPLQNTGTVPPQVEKETTYTVVWTATNSANHISSARVTAVLPSYVRWMGSISPQNGSVSFNETSRQVAWNIGELSQSSGSNVTLKEVAFQLGFTPSLSQVGEIPTLMHTQVITGYDQFVERQITRDVANITTLIQSESGLPSGHDRVVP